MSIKSHIALGTLLGLLLGAGAVAVLSRTVTPAASSAEADERERAPVRESGSDADGISPAALSGVVAPSNARRPMRPGAQRRLLQS